MKIKLIDVDSHGMPNLALLKLSAWHKAKGDEVGADINNPDRVYISCIFEQNKSKALGMAKFWKTFGCKVEIGGVGVDHTIVLPEEIDRIMPDYSFIPNLDCSVGYTYRACPNKCPWCVVPKQPQDETHRSIYEFWDRNHKKITLLDNNMFADPYCYETFESIIKEKLTLIEHGFDIRLVNDEIAGYLAKLKFEKQLHFAWDDLKLCPEEKVIRGIEILKNAGIKPYRLMFYMLVGYRNPTLSYEDVHRFKKLLEFGVDPFVMLYNNCRDRMLRKFARYVNKRLYKGRWSFYEDLEEIEEEIRRLERL